MGQDSSKNLARDNSDRNFEFEKRSRKLSSSFQNDNSVNSDINNTLLIYYPNETVFSLKKAVKSFNVKSKPLKSTASLSP